MKKLLIPVFLVILCFGVLVPTGNAEVTILMVNSHTITVTTTNTGLNVVEDLTVKNIWTKPCDTLEFWIQQNADEVSILAVENNIPLPSTISGNVYSCNLTFLNLSLVSDQTMTLRVTYTLPKTSEVYQKTTSYDTTSFIVLFNKKELFRSGSLAAGSSLQVLLYQPSEAPVNMTYLLILLVLVILLITVALLFLGRHRKKTVRSSGVESEELLTTQKNLLLTVLKEVEKQHRAKTISDETYTKLKDEYKQQAVLVMKKLDDLEKKR
ncbi:MAG: hypothetical protein V1726_04520 [Methanobacteriota archaeon]